MSLRIAAAVLSLTALWGCGDAGLYGDPDSGASRDGGVPDGGPLSDASGTDGGRVDDFDGIQAGASMAPDFRGEVPSPGATANPLSCYDNEDNDADEALDCDDASCQGLRSCCVGHGDCCAETGGVIPGSVTFATCGFDAPVTTCHPELPSFGRTLPFARDGVLSLGGDQDTGLYEGGVVLGSDLDLTSQRIRAEVVFRSADGCGISCLESAGIAVTEQDVFDEATVVRPVAGLLLSGSRDDVALVVGSEVVGRWPMTATTQRWALTIKPTGELIVEREDSPMPLSSGARFQPTRGLSLVLYGRSRNPDASGAAGAGVQSVELGLAICDMPAAWEAERTPLEISFEGTPVTLDDARAPSVAMGDGRTLLAFELPEGVAVADLIGDAVDLSQPPEVPALVGSWTHDEGGVRDPELIFDTDRWVLYYTAVNADGVASIGRAEGMDPTLGLASDPMPVIRPSLDILAVEDPTVFIHRDSSTWVMIAVVTRGSPEEPQRHLQLYTSPDGRLWAPRSTHNLEVLTDVSSNQELDADEVGSPSLMIHGGAWHLLFSARMGTRWRQELLVSDELLAWRPLGLVLEGTRGFDRLGTMEADAVSEADAVTAFYAGYDGVRMTLGRVVRPATDFGEFSR